MPVDEGRLLEDAQAAHDPNMLAAGLAAHAGEYREAVQLLEMRLAAGNQAIGVFDPRRADGEDLGVFAEQGLGDRNVGHPDSLTSPLRRGDRKPPSRRRHYPAKVR
jgi:hypothetical protein